MKSSVAAVGTWGPDRVAPRGIIFSVYAALARGRGVGAILARRRVWQGVLEWLRPGDAAESRVARHAGDAPIRGVSRAPRSAQTGRAPARANGRAALWQGTGDRGGLDSEPFGGPFGYGAGAEDGWADGDAAVAELASEAELLEFLASDLDPVPVDPVFRERLREELWSIVQADGLKRSGDH